MNIMRKVMTVAIMGVFLPLFVAEAKEDYKDPQKFAEKYVREDVEHRYPGKTYNPILQYKGFELVNVHSEMRETFSGPTSRVVCEFRVVPEKGVEYYQLDSSSFKWIYPGWFGYLSKGANAAGLTEERIKDIEGKIRLFCDSRPIMVKKTDITPKPGYAKDTIYVYRTRNEDGVFAPMRAAGAGSVFRYEGVGGWYNTNCLFTARTVKARGAIDSESEEGRAAYVAYSNKCEKIRAGIKTINEAVAAFNSVTNDHGLTASFARMRRGELEKERIAPLTEELVALEKSLKDQEVAAKKRMRDIKNRTASAERESQNLEKSLVRLEQSRKNTEKRIAEAAQATGRRAQNAQRQLPKLKANLADTVKKIEDANARLQSLTAQHAALKTEEQTAISESEKAQTATAAKIAEVKGKIDEQTKGVESQVSAEVKARFEQLAKDIQSQLAAIEGML